MSKTTKKSKTIKTGAKKAAKTRIAKARSTPTAGRKMSALDAAAKVLAEKGEAMSCPELIGVMAAKGYWSSPRWEDPRGDAGGRDPARDRHQGRGVAVREDCAGPLRPPRRLTP
jgi:hypothetical protein